MEQRIGIGYDIHRLVDGRPLVIGGVAIPYEKGLSGHSDADVLLHAVCDAILGAMGEPDIGELFPDTEARYCGIASSELITQVVVLLKKKGFSVVNVDTVVVAEEPKLTTYKKKIIARTSGLIGIAQDAFNMKTKTNEGLDSLGRKEAIAAYAVVLLTKGARV
jgi:2-C-methyl-D-erythritol 2,4-cyclodiphosphate synthase